MEIKKTLALASSHEKINLKSTEKHVSAKIIDDGETDFYLLMK